MDYAIYEKSTGNIINITTCTNNVPAPIPHSNEHAVCQIGELSPDTHKICRVEDGQLVEKKAVNINLSSDSIISNGIDEITISIDQFYDNPIIISVDGRTDIILTEEDPDLVMSSEKPGTITLEVSIRDPYHYSYPVTVWVK